MPTKKLAPVHPHVGPVLAESADGVRSRRADRSACQPPAHRGRSASPRKLSRLNKALPHFRLWLLYSDGVEGEVDLSGCRDTREVAPSRVDLVSTEL